MSSTNTIDQTSLDLALEQFQSARKYTLGLLEDLAPQHWFATPQPAISHIAWQVGHLAVAQYGLMLFRQRGRQSEDQNLLPGDFRKRFMKGSQPDVDPDSYPQPETILSVLHAIDQQVKREAKQWEPAALAESTEPPHAVMANRLGSLLFASHHEMLHAGQIGLLRRLLGLQPLR